MRAVALDGQTIGAAVHRARGDAVAGEVAGRPIRLGDRVQRGDDGYRHDHVNRRRPAIGGALGSAHPAEGAADGLRWARNRPGPC